MHVAAAAVSMAETSGAACCSGRRLEADGRPSQVSRSDRPPRARDGRIRQAARDPGGAIATGADVPAASRERRRGHVDERPAGDDARTRRPTCRPHQRAKHGAGREPTLATAAARPRGSATATPARPAAAHVRRTVVSGTCADPVIAGRMRGRPTIAAMRTPARSPSQACCRPAAAASRHERPAGLRRGRPGRRAGTATGSVGRDRVALEAATHGQRPHQRRASSDPVGALTESRRMTAESAEDDRAA